MLRKENIEATIKAAKSFSPGSSYWLYPAEVIELGTLALEALENRRRLIDMGFITMPLSGLVYIADPPIVAERDALKQELACAKQQLEQLKQQNQHLTNLHAKAEAGWAAVTADRDEAKRDYESVCLMNAALKRNLYDRDQAILKIKEIVA